MSWPYCIPYRERVSLLLYCVKVVAPSGGEGGCADSRAPVADRSRLVMTRVYLARASRCMMADNNMHPGERLHLVP